MSPRLNGLHNILITSIIPFDVGGILLLEYRDGFPIVDKLLILRLDYATEIAMCKIIWKNVGHVVYAMKESLLESQSPLC